MNPILGSIAPAPKRPGNLQSASLRKFFRVLAAAAIIFVGVLVIALGSHPANKDYISYWSAAKLLIHHHDPYSPAAVLAMEKAQGFTASWPVIMRNPPWAIFLILPLALGGPLEGLLLWTAAAVICVLVFIRLLNISSRDRAFAFVFAPAIACITSGQSSPFLLLGFSLFLYLYQRRPFLAGASLLLVAIKPHLFLVFWAVLLVESIYRRRFRVLIGGATALVAATALAMIFDGQIWRQYFAMLHASKLKQEFFPTGSMLFRSLIDTRAGWLLFVPSAVAVLWGLWYYFRKRRIWDWKTHGMILMLVTVFASPYGWFTDEIVLLPSIAFAIYLPGKRKYSVPLLLLVNCAAIVLLLMPHASLSSRIFIWTPAAWLVWFLYATSWSETCKISVQPAGPEDVQFV